MRSLFSTVEVRVVSSPPFSTDLVSVSQRSLALRPHPSPPFSSYAVFVVGWAFCGREEVRK